MQFYLQHIACDRRPVLAGDHTAWPRPTAYPADKIIRLRPNLRLFGPPPAYQGRGR